MLASKGWSQLSSGVRASSRGHIHTHNSPVRGSRAGSGASMDINMTSGGRTSVSTLVATSTTNINTALGYTRKDFSHCTDHGAQVATHATHNTMPPPPKQQSSRTPPRPPRDAAEAQSAYTRKDLRFHPCLGQQLRPQKPTWPPVASWIMIVF